MPPGVIVLLSHRSKRADVVLFKELLGHLGHKRNKQDQAEQDELDRWAQEEEDAQQAQRNKEEEEQRRETEKKKPKIGSFVRGQGIGNWIKPCPAQYALNKIHNLEYIELDYFTLKGCRDVAAEASRSISQDTLAFAHLEDTIAVRPLATVKTARNIRADEELSWTELMDAKHTMLHFMVQSKVWPDTHLVSLVAFYLALEMHPRRTQEHSRTVLALYQSRVVMISGLTHTRTCTRVKPIPVLTGMGMDRSAPQDTVLQSPPSPPPSVVSSSSLQSSLSSLLQSLLVDIIVTIVAAITVVVVESLVELEWQQGHRLAITPAMAVMGAAAVAFGTCVAMILAVGCSAGAGEVVVMSRCLHKLSTPGDAGFVLFALLTRATPSCYQPPPPPCRRQQQDAVNDDDDKDDKDDNNSDINNSDKVTRRVGRPPTAATARILPSTMARQYQQQQQCQQQQQQQQQRQQR
ncbi:hypothetical protein EDB83DRAFT_2520964 [Lactarius deliciosus]|nr:hypothetical protein EDB83DRAFT_2520964 [Lactarius deliciosus]